MLVGAADVAVGVTMQEHAEETLEASPPQFDTNVGRAALALGDAVYVGQKALTSEDFWIN